MAKTNLSPDDVCELLQGIWQTVFSIPLPPATPGAIAVADQRSVAGCIQITGSWEGAAVLRCSATLAQKLAAAMLGTEQLEHNDVVDAMGELTNLAAGALQTLLVVPSELTPPTVVVEGSDYSVFLPGSAPIIEQWFDCWSEPLSFAVFESNRCIRTVELSSVASNNGG